jgi:hypothetical protein
MTSIEWLIKELNLEGYDHTIQQAKEMEKQEIIDAHKNGEYLIPHSENAELYYQETYGSKGSDTLKDYHIVDTNEMVQLPQQEISDEEIEKAAFEYIKPPRQTPEKSDGYNEYDVFAAFKAGVKHREQLKQL